MNFLKSYLIKIKKILNWLKKKTFIFAFILFSHDFDFINTNLNYLLFLYVSYWTWVPTLPIQSNEVSLSIVVSFKTDKLLNRHRRSPHSDKKEFVWERKIGVKNF